MIWQHLYVNKLQVYVKLWIILFKVLCGFRWAAISQKWLWTLSMFKLCNLFMWMVFFGTHKFKCPLNCLLQKNYKHMFPQPLNYKWIHQYLCFTCIISQPIYYFIWRSKAWDFNRVLASSAGGPGFNPKSRTASYQRRYKNGTSSSQV